MKSIGSILLAVLEILQIELAVDGISFSFWQIFLWSIVAGVVIWLVLYWMGD